MKSPSELHEDQIAFWNGPGGARWVAGQARIDVMLAPVLGALLRHAAVRPGDAVLDIGCGSGAATIELARRVGPTGRVVGLDVSAPMLACARERSAGIANIDFVGADAAVHRFAEPFDLLFSRFGVMFFGDPVAAFANLRRALKPGGRLVFACWRDFDENLWMKVPLKAAYAHVPKLPPVGPEDPGPFAFADRDRVTRILAGGGFVAPRFTPADLMLDLSAGGGLAAAVEQATTVGAASRAMQDQPETAREAATEAIREALAPYVAGDQVLLPGTIWLVDAAGSTV